MRFLVEQFNIWWSKFFRLLQFRSVFPGHQLIRGQCRPRRDPQSKVSSCSDYPESTRHVPGKVLGEIFAIYGVLVLEGVVDIAKRPRQSAAIG